MTWIRKTKEHKCSIPLESVFPSWVKPGDIWECDICNTPYKVFRIDYGHDDMPGEKSFGLSLKKVLLTDVG